MTMAAIRFGTVSPEWFETTDAEFLAALKWRDHETVLRPVDPDVANLKTVGLAWKQQCLEHRANKIRHSFATLDTLLVTQPDALPTCLSDLRQELLTSAASRKKSANGRQFEPLEAALRDWLSTQQQRDSGLVVLAGLELLLFHADRLAAQTVGELWRWTLSAALSLSEHLVEIEENEETEHLLDSENVMTVALSSALLPWLCGLFFDDVKGAPKLAKSGRQSLTSLLVSGTDDSGAPVACVVRSLSWWIGLWNDALVAGRRFNQAVFKDSVERRFANYLKCITSVVINTSNGASVIAQMLIELPSLLNQKYDEGWVHCLESAHKDAKNNGSKHKFEDTGKKKDAASWQSDTCAVACLRTSWKPDASSITVLHDQRQLRLTLTVNGQTLIDGDWGLTVLNQTVGCDSIATHPANGSGWNPNLQPVTLTKDWECCCWYTDKDVDFAEWIAETSDGLKVCRWAMLHRTEEYAILSDVVKNASPVRVDVQSTWPLATHSRLGCPDSKAPSNQNNVESTSPTWNCSGVAGSREQRFQRGSQRVRVFPLMLPQDVGFGTSGSIESLPNAFRLSTAATHGGLFSPVVLDWNSKRANSEVEWRELTVSEAGVIDPSSGRGFRVAIGKHNLLLMRGLRTISRYRTVLGYQTWNETVIASLNKDGIFDEILLVEQ